ncbi:GRAM domain-containing protein [Micromonospora sp. WMMD1082]|uniref:GRAM domain-containing protein n=1 Tax=Micromonospora sp. WMMD1082 TaxID=3016104 RepID=UPI00241649A5|nr:GRAM domain-containing protein [Micromonospora sp. WMMD1082]MDG4794271.1 GRAM domain-containing protein [Micromonospora sp. WMMD1082]
MSDANILISRRANLWRGVESVGGRLTLTDQYLSFRAHALNVQTAPLNIPLQDIVATRKYRNLGLVPNGLAVATKSGVEYRFAVGKRAHFIDKIAELTPR